MLSKIRQSLMLTLMLAIVAGCAVSAAIVGGGAYLIAAYQANSDVRANLSDPLDLRASRLADLSNMIFNDLQLLTNLEAVQSGIPGLSSALIAADAEIGDGAIYQSYVDDNPYPLGERDKLTTASDGSGYSDLHAKFHPELRSLLQSRGYYDIFLIDLDGRIVYTVAKESDFATNLNTGAYKETGLARAYDVAQTYGAGEYSFADFSNYGPSGSAPASFVAMPVFHPENGQLVGVVAVQVMPGALEAAIMAETQNSLSQTVLVGPEGLLRTDFHGLDTDAVMETRITLPDDPKFATGTTLDAVGLSGEPVLMAARPVNFLGNAWHLVTLADKEGALSSLNELRRNMLLLIVPALAVVAIGAWTTARLMVRPIQRIETVIREMNAGDLEVTVPETERMDEIGSMARGTEEFRKTIVQSRARRAERNAEEKRLHSAKAAMLSKLESNVGAVVIAVSNGELNRRVDADFDDEAINRLAVGINEICDTISTFADQIESSMSAMAKGDLTNKLDSSLKGRFREVCDAVNSSIDVLDDMVKQLGSTGTAMTKSVKSVSDGARDLAGRAEAQSASLQESAATMEEIANAITQNAENTQKVTDLAANTSERANRGRKVVIDAVSAMSEIEESSQKISETTSTIDSIAFQTNLLALNAAVEAARAGDAGKGFAVVASEVRTLAQRSSAAARDITDLILASSAKVSEGVRLVNATGDSLSGIVEAISSLSGTINEISDASREQSAGVAEITNAVSNMDSMTQKNARLADSSASAALQLENMSEQLATIIQFFKSSEVALPADGAIDSETDAQPKEDFNEDQADQDWMQATAKSGDVDVTGTRRIAANGDEWADF